MGQLIFHWLLLRHRRKLEASLAAGYTPEAGRQLDAVLFLLESERAGA